jgi:hypothetical protein
MELNTAQRAVLNRIDGLISQFNGEFNRLKELSKQADLIDAILIIADLIDDQLPKVTAKIARIVEENANILNSSIGDAVNERMKKIYAKVTIFSDGLQNKVFKRCYRTAENSANNHLHPGDIKLPRQENYTPIYSQEIRDQIKVLFNEHEDSITFIPEMSEILGTTNISSILVEATLEDTTPSSYTTIL